MFILHFTAALSLAVLGTRHSVVFSPTWRSKEGCCGGLLQGHAAASKAVLCHTTSCHRGQRFSLAQALLPTHIHFLAESFSGSQQTEAFIKCSSSILGAVVGLCTGCRSLQQR